MKSKLLLLLGLFFTLTSLAQTDGWYLYTKVSEITKIVPDDSNSDELHLATDIGYIKYNTSTNSVTEFLNLTSQDPAIGSVKDIVLDPTSNDIAFTLIDGIGIYDGNTVVTYRYDNSDLTIGETTSQFLSLQLEYAKDGSLYIFKEDVLGYQILNTGVFEPETVTPFRPQDIIENDAGTKAFFASDTDGLWELDKSTDTWTNYTTSNSNLISNFLLSLYVDTNDLLYVGGFQGLNTLSSSDVWNTYQGLDPINAFPYQVHEISLNETTGDLVVNTSAPSIYFYGLTVVDLNTNTWTNYREDDSNCLNENSYNATAFGGDGKVYAAPQIFSSIPDIGKLVEFTPSTESCSDVDINYLNAPIAINSNVITDFSLRKRTNGNIDIGFTRTFDFHFTEIDPTSFNGSFPSATTLTPLPGEFIGTVNSDNNKFIIDTNTGWLVFDESNNTTVLDHNLPDYLSIVTKIADVSDSQNGIATFVHKGFDAAFNYLVYKTICDIPNESCTVPEQILTEDRDLTKNTSFGAKSGLLIPEFRVLAASSAAPPALGIVINGFPHQSSSGSPFIMPAVLATDPKVDPFPLDMPPGVDDFGFFIVNDNIETTFVTIDGSGNPVADISSIDTDNDGEPDEIAAANELVITQNDGEVVGRGFATNFTYFGGGKSVKSVEIKPDNNNPSEVEYSEIPDAELSNNLPKNLLIRKVEVIQTSPTTILLSFLTNYGLLVKNAIDISSITLSNNEVSLNNEDIYLYPNPASDSVAFSDDSVVKIEVYNIQGKKILALNTGRFSVKKLPDGLYVVKATNRDGIVLTRKLIKN